MAVDREGADGARQLALAERAPAIEECEDSIEAAYAAEYANWHLYSTYSTYLANCQDPDPPVAQQIEIAEAVFLQALYASYAGEVDLAEGDNLMYVGDLWYAAQNWEYAADSYAGAMIKFSFAAFAFEFAEMKFLAYCEVCDAAIALMEPYL